MKKLLKYFSVFDAVIIVVAISAITASYLIFEKNGYLKLFVSLIGVISVLFTAKGNPIGQALTVAFSILYGILSYRSRYYGEMITYLTMSMPMAIIALISWIKNPYKNDKLQVKVNAITSKEIAVMLVLTTAVTIAFYFILKALNTANLIVSTVSVATSFTAGFLVFRRSPYYALCYALNDVVLMVLWLLMAISDSSFVPVVVCFCIFLAFDIYGLINWLKLQKLQKENK